MTDDAERFVSPCKPPEGCKREVLDILIEECSEITIECIDIIKACADVQQRATKALRFGIDEVQPGQDDSNSVRLAHEIGDLLEVIDVAIQAELFLQDDIEAGRIHKRAQLKKFMQSLPEQD